MIGCRFVFRTNLDKAKPYVEALNATPGVGEGTHWAHDQPPAVGDELWFQVHATFSFELRVVAVRWHDGGRECRVELHLPAAPQQTIREWMEWFESRRRCQ